MRVLRRKDFPELRFSLIFIGYGAETLQSVIELTHNWATEDYKIGNAYGHIAIQCDDLYAMCDKIQAGSGELLGQDCFEGEAYEPM